MVYGGVRWWPRGGSQQVKGAVWSVSTLSKAGSHVHHLSFIHHHLNNLPLSAYCFFFTSSFRSAFSPCQSPIPRCCHTRSSVCKVKVPTMPSKYKWKTLYSLLPSRLTTRPSPVPVPLLDQWMASRQSTSPLSLLKDTTLGIEASHYLDQYLKPRAKKEPLLPALGGFPFTLQHAIENDLTALRAASITPLFVFAGLDFNHQVLDSDVDVESAPLIKEAWGYYSRGQAGNVVDAFLDAGKSAVVCFSESLPVLCIGSC